MNILTSLLGGNLGDLFQKIVGSFKASPDKVLEFQAAIAANQESINKAEEELKVKALDLEAQLNDTAGQNIRAEQTSNDKYVERARPTVIWMGCLMLFWNYCLVPTFGAHWGLGPVNLPDAFYWTWGTVVTGYVFMRTGQDVLNRTVGGAGGTVNLPFGFKLDSQGDQPKKK